MFNDSFGDKVLNSDWYMCGVWGKDREEEEKRRRRKGGIKRTQNQIYTH